MVTKRLDERYYEMKLRIVRMDTEEIEYISRIPLYRF